MPKRKSLTTAEKRAQLAARGEEWPLYPDGTKKMWMPGVSYREGGRWLSFDEFTKKSERSRRYREDNRERERERVRNYREEKPNEVRESRRKIGAARAGRLPDEKRLTPSEVAARANRTQCLRRINDDEVAMKMLEERNPRRAKLIRLALHPATPPFERRRALDRLMPKEHTHGG